MEKLLGTRFGSYEIMGPLGAGGMGEVYRAKDPRLKREVAIKILPAESMADPERQRRFQQEAQAASALNHPNILVVYDIGNENGAHYIVSELVEGEPLRKLIQKGPLPLKTLLDFAVQIADGLAAAHQAGIAHRDLKPENIMVSREGRVKILDFGLAKLLKPEVGGEEDQTLSRAYTQTGTILGTVPYMSPEQASGKSIDFRSDQFSFGLILYEMATGQRAFTRKSAAETLSAIINEEPPAILSLNSKVPAPVRWLIDRCLAKDPRQRFAATLDLYHGLRDLRDHLSEATSAEVVAPAAAKRSITKLLAATVALLLIAATFLLTRLSFAPTSPDFSSYRFTPLATEEGSKGSPAWSPDGKTIAYVAQANGVRQIFTRSLASPTATQLPQSDRVYKTQFWSPDGARIYYTDVGLELMSIGAAGGSPQKVLDDSIRSATLSPDGKALVYMREGTGYSNSIWISTPLGAKPKEYKEPPFDKKVYWHGVLHFSPDGSKIGLWIPTLQSGSVNEFWIIPYPAGKPRRTLQAISNVGGDLFFSWMPDSRRIVFAENIHGTPSTNLWMADTRDNSIRPLTIGETNEVDPSVSPDGEKIAFVVQEANQDLIEIPLDGSPMRSLLSTSRNEFHPAWSSIGNQYAYVTDRSGSSEIWLRSPQEGWERPLVTQNDFGSDRTAGLGFPIFLPDGRRIAYSRVSAKGEWSLWLSAVAGGPPVRVTRGGNWTNGGSWATWSPDGDWIAYARGSATDFSLVKEKVPGGQSIDLKQKMEAGTPRWSPKGDWISCETPDGLVLVSPDGQKHRVLSERVPDIHGWSKDGSTIYALRDWTLVSIDVQTGKEKNVSEPGIETPSFQLTWNGGFSLAPDGKRFATTVVRLKGDIWLLEGFNKQLGFFERLWKR